MHLIQKGRTDFYTNKKASSNVALPQMEKDSDTPKGARNIDNASAKVNNNSESGEKFVSRILSRTFICGGGPLRAGALPAIPRAIPWHASRSHNYYSRICKLES